MLVSLGALIILSLILFNLGKFIPVKFGYLIFALIGVAISGSAFIFPPAMLSEIINKANKKEKSNMEGLYFGIQGFFLKFAFLISVGIIPILLVSGNNIDFSQIFLNKTSTVQISGIYNSTLFSTFSFVLSGIFYYLYKE